MVLPGMNYEKNRELVGQVINSGVPCKHIFESRKSDSGGDGAGRLISGAVNGVNSVLCFHKWISRMSTVGMRLELVRCARNGTFEIGIISAFRGR